MSTHDTKTVGCWDVIVLGCGPAGSATATLLAREGFRVLVLERASFPRPKLCGEFLSPEARAPLARLGVLARVLAAGVPEVTGALLSDAEGRSATVAFESVKGLDGPGLGLQRTTLDGLLAARAREAGAELREGFTALAVSWEHPGRLTVRGRPTKAEAGTPAPETELRAKVVVGADGRSTLCAADREEMRRLEAPYLGIKAHFRGVEELAGRVELHVFPGGYGGLVAVDGGVVNACFLVEASAVKCSRGDLDGLLRDVLCANPLLRRRLEKAERADAWISTGPLAYVPARRPMPGTVLVGDAAGFIDPFTGEGMAMALRGAEIAARYAAVGALASGITPQMMVAYHAERVDEFRRRQNVARLLRTVATRPRVARVVVPLLRRMPALGRLLVGATRRT